MTLRTDHHRFAIVQVQCANPEEGLPSGTALQFNRLAQLLHREYLLIGIEKDLEITC